MADVIELFGNQSKGKDMRVESFRVDIVRPALELTNLWSQAGENLLVGTALTESNLDVVKQIGGGPALSFFQIETLTYLDCIRYLNRRDNRRLKDAILSACYVEMFPNSSCLTWNIRLATLMARVKYWMIPESLPIHTDAASLCNYYLTYYNTDLGKNTFERAIPSFVKACAT